MAGTLEYLPSEGSQGKALSTPPQRASRINTVLVLDPQTELNVQDAYLKGPLKLTAM